MTNLSKRYGVTAPDLDVGQGRKSGTAGTRRGCGCFLRGTSGQPDRKAPRRTLPCQQNARNRCATRRSRRSCSTVEAEGKRSLGVQGNVLFHHLLPTLRDHHNTPSSCSNAAMGGPPVLALRTRAHQLAPEAGLLAQTTPSGGCSSSRGTRCSAPRRPRRAPSTRIGTPSFAM